MLSQLQDKNIDLVEVISGHCIYLIELMLWTENSSNKLYQFFWHNFNDI